MNTKTYIEIASAAHLDYADEICRVIANAASRRGTGIAKRSPQYIRKKIQEGKAVIAITDEGKLAGFCYIETWSHGKYVANSGLIVVPEYRELGLGKKIKAKAFELSIKKYPQASLFGITTNPAVMKINSSLGYRAVGFAELTADEAFWSGCKSCKNYDILVRTGRTLCLCTAMLYEPVKKTKHADRKVKNAKKKSGAGL